VHNNITDALPHSTDTESSLLINDIVGLFFKFYEDWVSEVLPNVEIDNFSTPTHHSASH
jgi:hypothetical protein